MEINEKIRWLREDNDINQTTIAKLLKTSQSYYSEYELGKRQIPIQHIKTLCEYYKISADYLLGLPEGMEYPHRYHSTKYDFDMLTVIIAVSFSYIL